MVEINSILDVENHIDNLDAVIFDLDDTLYSEKQYVRSGYKKIAELLALPQIEEEMWNVFLNGGKAIDEVLLMHGLTNKKEEALHIYRHQKPDIHLYDGTAEMIIRIRRDNKVGIITDGRPEGQRAKLDALGIEVDNVIITDELGGIEYRKPNETAFRLMKKKFNVKYTRMVYIGDNKRKDFIAPDKLGMNSIWFHNLDGIYR